jgi:hypothetical protein
MLADITSEQWPASGWNQWPTSSEYTDLVQEAKKLLMPVVSIGFE